MMRSRSALPDGLLHLLQRNSTPARRLPDKALKLNPNLAAAWLCSGWVRVSLGEPELAIEHVTHAMRLNPFDPLFNHMQAAIATAHFFAGRYDDASSWAERHYAGSPNI